MANPIKAVRAKVADVKAQMREADDFLKDVRRTNPELFKHQPKHRRR